MHFFAVFGPFVLQAPDNPAYNTHFCLVLCVGGGGGGGRGFCVGTHIMGQNEMFCSLAS